MTRTIPTARLGVILLGAGIAAATLAAPLPLVPLDAFDIEQLSAGDDAAVAIAGDRLVLGLPDAAVDGNTGAGTLWTWRMQGGHWVAETEAFSLADVSEPLDGSPHFGTAVAASGDLVLVGCPRCGQGGKAFLFIRRDDHWQSIVIVGPAADDPGEFGAAVALAGDQIAIGAPTSGDSFSPGAVWLGHFDRAAPGSVVTEQMWFGEQDNERFGEAVALVQSQNETTLLYSHTLLVGAPSHRNAANEPIGRAMKLVREDSGMWQSQQDIANTNPGGDDRFGAAVAIWRPGSPQPGYLAIGAPGASHGGQPGGVVRLYRNTFPSTEYAFDGEVQHPGAGLDDAFGSGVSLNGTRLLVGAPGFDPVQGPDAGASYVFERVTSSLWTQTQNLFPRANDGLFGTAVAWSGTHAAIATPLAGAAGEPANRVQTYMADLIFADGFE